MKTSTKSIIVVGISLLATACGTKSGVLLPGPDGAVNQNSSLTAISIGLPDRAALKTQVADIETKMNGFHLIIGPVDVNCMGATKINQIDGYAAAPVVNASLAQGCDYDVILAIGQKADGQPQTGGNTTPAGAPSYEGKIKPLVDAKCVSCHKSGAQFPDLSNFAAVKAQSASLKRRVDAGTMPPSGALAGSDRDLVTSWIDGGMLEKDAPAATLPAQPSVPADKLAAVYYKNSVALRIKKEDIAGKASYKVPLSLQIQEDGKKIGLGATANNGGGGVQPADPTQPVPPTPPTPPTPSTQIPADRDFEMVDASGKTEKLSAAFKGKYMLLDFSSSTCGYCIQRAAEMEQDKELQKLLDGTKCSHATVVPADDLASWHQVAGGANSFVGKHSYQATSSRIGKIVEAFGVQFAGTPTFILVDDAGKAVADSNGIPENEIRQYCK